ncbi:MAG: UDP-N-acetylglucosamine 1-carboxyvinyltransferase [bacterium]|nr:UDP-N-acetylglucosamine 1-carboxyvinyltransferase [bacterium]
MDKIRIIGGQKLEGEVEISGSKNSTLPLMTASILANEKCVLHNIPKVQDVHTMELVLNTLGIRVNRENNHTLIIDPIGLSGYEAPYDLVRKMRASIYVLGPLLAKLKKARVSLPGGCAIGLRPINLHIKGIQALGAKVEIEEGFINATADKLKGTEIYLDLPSVGATVNIMLAAVVAEGKTLIENAAQEPEIEDVASFMNKMGAKITGAGTPVIQIEGVEELTSAEHTVIPDRIEAGTYIIAAALTQGNVKVTNAVLDHLLAVQTKLVESGVRITQDKNGLRVTVPNQLRPSDIKTSPYPGFPTDLQAQFMTLMSITEGNSVITETIWENRFMHVGELQRMGANIRIQGNSAFVTGVPYLSGAPVMASDLRASATLILAGLVAKGKTVINRVYHLDRGYEGLVDKLTQLGANIERVKE